MILLKHLDFDSELEFEWFCELVVENQKMYREILKEFSVGKVSDQEEKVGIFSKGKMIEAKDRVFIDNVFRMNFGDKKLQTALVKKLSIIAMSEDFYDRSYEIFSQIERYFLDLVDSAQFCFDVVCSEVNFEELAKSVSFEVGGSGEEMLDLITGYLDLVVDLIGDKLFIFAGLRAILADEEFLALLEYAKSKELKMIFLESTDRGAVEDCARLVIDNDLCEI